MADEHIKVTCTSCNSTIRAPRAAGGKRGKCPKCGNSVYVPMPDDELEEIPLEPLDEQGPDELLRESAALTSDLLREKNAADADRGSPSGESASAPSPRQTINVGHVIVQYLVAMKASKLDDCATLVGQLARVRAQALSRVQQMMVDAMPPPQLGDLPAPLYMGFLKKLQSELED